MDAKEKSLFCAQRVAAKKAHDVLIIDIHEHASFADYFVICSGTSTRQVQAIAEHLQESMKEAGFRALGIEGMRTGRWVLLDYADVIVHVFHSAERTFYGLEDIWSECPRIVYEDE
ncbi:MAG: ribosome silencing factor [Desulfobacterota bacterium]|nr:ribosome silencing factor [Thermodesulfobacteriota bacterium]